MPTWHISHFGLLVPPSAARRDEVVVAVRAGDDVVPALANEPQSHFHAPLYIPFVMIRTK